jgi:hypothetical protein
MLIMVRGYSCRAVKFFAVENRGELTYSMQHAKEARLHGCVIARQALPDSGKGIHDLALLPSHTAQPVTPNTL